MGIELHTFEDVAKMFSVTPKTIRRFVKEGKIETIDLFGSQKMKRITELEVKRILKEGGLQ